ncbi:MAG: DNA repair protein RadA [Candidatus Omnitrophica bacterium]|nr:DNA repair protein RadA [Candidatus Omnitrophota bacterium]
MTKTKTFFVCQNCGYRSLRWLGKCPDCETWNSLVEETVVPTSRSKKTLEEPRKLLDIESLEEKRIITSIGEFDNLLGGGIVPGSVILVGGNPGIGKSTLLLQVSNGLSARGSTVLYVSGEESARQTKLRADRLGAGVDNLYIVNETDVEVIIEHIEKLKPQVVVIDSIQILYKSEFSSSPGTVSQVRECSHILTSLAKSRGMTIFLIGHVTKEGALAGPKVLEHLVDTVLYFEGESFTQKRILRAVKNRFGSTNEIAIFDMTSSGLIEVTNPSEILLGEREDNVPGSVIVPVIEGTRPLLIEIQSLVVSSGIGFAKRRSMGLDFNRIPLLVAVLEKRLGLQLGSQDIFVNVVGGIRIMEPAIDLGVVLGIVSSFRNRAIEKNTVVLGEVGLGGEVRAVSFTGQRVQEAQKLGFKRCILPKISFEALKVKGSLELVGVKNIEEAIKAVLD